MKRFKVKFFGSKEKKVQVKLVKTVVEASRAIDVEEVLKRKFGYVVINSLKIRECNEQSEVIIAARGGL